MFPVPIHLDKNNANPMYMQLANQITQMIHQKQLVANTPLPSIRKLASHLGVNTVTIVSAYKQLETNGLVQAKKGSGYFIIEKAPKTSTHVLDIPMKQMTQQQIHLRA